MTIGTNGELSRKLKGQRGARFCLCDFHVHSLASHDVVTMPDLSDYEKERLKNYLGNTPKDWVKHQQDILDAFPPSEYLSRLTDRRDQVVSKLGIGEYNQWAIIAITDHNICSYAVELARSAWDSRKKNKLIVLPGIELDVVFPISTTEDTAIHVLCIFSPGVDSSDIRKAICDASSSDWKEGVKSLTVTSLQHFINKLRHHPQYPSMVIAAHVWSRKGVQNEVKRLLTAREAAIAQIEAEVADANPADQQRLKEQIEKLKPDKYEGDIAAGVLQTIGQCGFDALQVRSKSDEKHYRRLHRFREEHGRSVPIVSSDAHCLEEVFHVAGDLYPQMKLTNDFNKLNQERLFDEIRDHAIRCGETRFSYTYGGEVTHWIEGIEIIRDSGSAANFWPDADGLVLPFSRNLNCMIGGRGSGKSAIVEALSFLINPEEAKDHGKFSQAKWDAWYMRARATLSGCNLRLCWRAFGNVDNDFHKGVFLSRYFDPNDRHGEASVTNVSGDTVISPVLPTVQLYRFHDIERAAEAEGLRKLIDEVAGGIGEIEERIDSIRSELSLKSSEFISLAAEINDLTKDGTPLRRYVKRSLDYARVNKKEVEQHFKKLDAIESAGKNLKQMRNQWEQYTGKLVPDDLVDLETLVTDISAAVAADDEKYLSGLSQLIVGEDAPVKRFLAALREVLEWKDKTEEGFSEQFQIIADQYTALRDELERQGVPTGAKDREAKKKELGEANDALKEYRDKISQFDTLYGERNELFGELVLTCQRRTDLRVKTADNITTQLRQDLDDSVLRIEASAQPMADKSSFENWLDKYLSGAFKSYRKQRIHSLLQGGLTPKVLRDLLLGKRSDGLDILSRDAEKISDGKISEEDVNAILGMAAVATYEPEVSPHNIDIDPEIYAELPTEIKEGFCYFPTSGDDQLQIAKVLMLDEIVFNDVPIVYLNDRPQEQGSALRPLHELSPGQRCSAVLPILLLNGRSPLIIDQPEDNLDNRLIRQVIVNVLVSIKLRRQVIVATHNPNLPVLGDAEQTIVLAAIDEKQSQVRAQGNLDERPIVDAVTEIMEGGREAFQYRQSIYQAHWEGSVAQE